jgi:hypothetical protein
LGEDRRTGGQEDRAAVSVILPSCHPVVLV